MKFRYYIRRILLVAASLLQFLSGCVGVQPAPTETTSGTVSSSTSETSISSDTPWSETAETTADTPEPLNIAWDPYIVDSRVTNKEAMYKLIDALMNYQPSVTFDSEDEMFTAYIGISMSFPPSYLAGLDGRKETKTIYINYIYPEEEHCRRIEEFREKVEEIVVRCCLSEDDDIAKALKLYRYICQNVTYAYNYGDEENGHRATTSYSALINGTAICTGFTDAYNYLLWQVGVPAWQVSGLSGKEGEPNLFAHAWSLIYINGKYYFCDATFEQGITFGNGLVRFGMTTEQVFSTMKGKWSMGAYSWNTRKIPEVTDTSFAFAQAGQDFTYNSETGELTVKNGTEYITQKVK